MPSILNATKGFAHGLHEIISSDIDADRLDYVSRDAVSIGMTKTSLPYERLLASFELVYFDRRPIFAPRVQALSSIEGFFSLRFAIYKYAVHHHRVMKTDALLRSIICGLAREYLASPETECDIAERLVPQNIGSLWGILAISAHGTTTEWSTHYMQWDDAWLLTTLRMLHLSPPRVDLQNEPGSCTNDVIGAPTATARDPMLTRRMEEFLSNDKQYHSLYKRTDGFLVLEDAFVASAVGWMKRQIANKTLINDDASYVVQFREYVNAVVDSGVAEARKRHGLFTSLVLELLQWHGVGGRNLRNFLETAGKSVTSNSDLEIEELIIERKAVKPGITASTSLVREGERISIDEVSCIGANLRHQARMVPPFFIYVFGQNATSGEKTNSVCAAFGKELWAQCKPSLEEKMCRKRKLAGRG